MPVDALPPVLNRMLALWNGGEVDPAEVYARVPEDVMPTVEKYRAAFPDLRWSVEQWFAAGDRYILRMQAIGTHTGAPFASEIGVAEPSGQTFALHGIEVHELRDDRIVDSWQVWDMSPLHVAFGARV